MQELCQLETRAFSSKRGVEGPKRPPSSFFDDHGRRKADRARQPNRAESNLGRSWLEESNLGRFVVRSSRQPNRAESNLGRFVQGAERAAAFRVFAVWVGNPRN